MTTARRALTLLGAAALLAATAGSASAETGGATAVVTAACDGVTVIVDLSELGGAVASGCAEGDPASGREALESAGFTPVNGPSGFICTIDGQPDPCPTEFTGSFWAYWQVVDGEWVSSQVGADDTDPAPGDIEGWRYDDGSVPPPLPAVEPEAGGEEPADEEVAPSDTATPTDDPTSTAEDGDGGGISPGLWTLLGVVVVALIAGFVLRRERKSGLVILTAERAVPAPAPTLRARALHPLAWWAWALALAAALSRIANPVAVLLIVAAVVLVVLACRGDDRWGRAFRGYLILAGVVVVVRLAFYVLVGLDGGGPLLLDLPSIELPTWAGGIDLLGPIRLTGLLGALYGGLALGVLLLCFGAANSLSDPVRALRSLPAALHPLGTAVVVAVTVAPRLITSFARVRRAQRLRGVAPKGWQGLRATVVPVLGDALDHALALAASMDSRGYARSEGSSRGVGAALTVALLAAVVGTYGLLDGQAPTWLGVPMLLVGAAVAAAAAVVAGRRSRRTRYRPDSWGWSESLVAASGVAAAALALSVPALRQTGLPGAPPVALAMLLVAVLAAIPAVLRWAR